MSLTPVYIAGYQSGKETNRKPFLLLDTAFPELQNAYVYRERVLKREGLQLAGRLRRCYTTPVTLSTQANGASYDNADILNDPSIAVRVVAPPAISETDAIIEPGSMNVVVGGLTFVEPSTPDGTLSAGGGNIGFINYVTGELKLNFSPALGIATNVNITFCYFPMLPAMGIWQREIAGINDFQSIFFDRKYAYSFDGNNFQELASTTPTTWTGTDSDFFWATNYRGSEPANRLFFATNFVNDSTNPMRYYDGITWTTFSPFVGGQRQEEGIGTLPNPWNAFAGSLTKLPIIKGTVEITVENEPDGIIIYRDTPKDGTLTGPGLNNGTINYATGAITLVVNPAFTANATVTAKYFYGTAQLFQARILIPYYGRLLALNVWEGPTVGTASNIFNRCRFSQVGNPIEQDAWRSDTIGKGGFIDAPVNEEIISAIFYKNTLIVFFEQSTWELRYVGEYGFPFLWERISSDFGSESTFSSILFDKGVLAVGDKAIIRSSGVDVERIDLAIPDTVFSFRNEDNGTKRVHGIRDFRKELVYWCYSDSQFKRKYPNKTLLYNYRNNTFAEFRNNVTCFGNLQSPNGITWDSQSVYWDNEIVTWDDALQENYPLIVSGNQQGFIHFYGYADVESSPDSKIDALDQESLAISNIDVSAAIITLTVKNHNLENGEIVYMTGLDFVDTTTSLPGSTILNDAIYQVERQDDNTILLHKWDSVAQRYVSDFTRTTTGTYMGGGVLALFPLLNIRTKDFNPFERQGNQFKLSYVDFQTDATPGGLVTVNLLINSALNEVANVLVGNQQLDMDLTAPFYIPGSQYAWHRFFATANGQYLAVQLTYNDDLMNTLSTHQQLFEMNAMTLWVRKGSMTVF